MCEYCEYPHRLVENRINNNEVFIDITGNRIQVRIWNIENRKGYIVYEGKIKYCPVCGRELENETNNNFQ